MPNLLLRINLAKREYSIQKIDSSILSMFYGGRGIAAWILWNELRPGVDPLGPDNKLVFAIGPLTGLPIPSSSKLLVAAKSPLTGGYGDGVLGTELAIYMRILGICAIVVEGKSEKPIYVHISESNGRAKVEFEDAEDLWGLNAFEAEDRLKRAYGREAGLALIGPGGENLVRFATITAGKGRSGGRPGMGAVMGSKRLKAIVATSSKTICEICDDLQRLGAEAFKAIKSSAVFDNWIKQGTMATVRLAQELSVLPAYNFSEGQFDGYERLTAEEMRRREVRLRSCPICNMPCGHVVKDDVGREVELDYENVAMLGSNLGIDDLAKVARLNRLADLYGIDTISLGNVIGFAMEASERGLLEDKIEWGDDKKAMELIGDIVYGWGSLGRLLMLGVREAASRIGKGAFEFAMHVKGLEITAYDCHAAPGMALAYGTSPIGAHHKDAWLIVWESQVGRLDYSRYKVEKLVELQNIRGGFFECMVVCRFPWVEGLLGIEWYYKFAKAILGIDFDYDKVALLGDRVYSLIRAFWIREYGGWDISLDIPPPKWFKRPLSKGPFKGARLEYDGYMTMLRYYYQLRGWNERGIPRRGTLERLGLKDVADCLGGIVDLQ